ncbi:MAG: hypothetical protein R2867_40935 [Caldilineaceae bacterium]
MDADRAAAQLFETFGYLGFPGLLADRAAEIDAAFEAVWTERRWPQW